MAQTKTGFITLTDINDGVDGIIGVNGISGNSTTTHTAYQNYITGTATSLPAEVDLDADGLLANSDLISGACVSTGSLNGTNTLEAACQADTGFVSWTQYADWLVAPSTPTGANATFFTTRRFEQTAGTGNFVGQGTWSTASRLTGDVGRPGDPGVSNTGRYSDLQTSTGFVTTSLNTGRWKILTDDGAIPNATDGVNVWTTSVDVLFLASVDENGSDISNYYGQLLTGDTGRLQTDAAATPGTANIPEFCDVSSVESEPFICDSPPGYVVFTLNSPPVRMDPDGTPNAVDGTVWRMSIDTVRVDNPTTVLSTTDGVVANFGYNRTSQGEDGTDGLTGGAGAAGSRGPGRFDISIDLADNSAAPTVGASDDDFNNDARQALCEALNKNWTEATKSCDAAIGVPIAGDIIVITYTSLDGSTTTTRGAIHDGNGTGFGNWAAFTIQIDGNLLVQGSVVANALAVGSVTSSKIDILPADIGAGSNANGTTSRMVITGDRIEIYEGNTLRVVLGNLN